MSMRLIEADTLKKALCKRCLRQNSCTKSDDEYCEKMEEMIGSVPTVEAFPVSVLEQIKWERDSLAEQIREIGGKPFAKWDADIVKVVRCKDCKYWDVRTTNKKGFVVCNATHMDCTENDFCSFGEKVTE